MMWVAPPKAAEDQLRQRSGSHRKSDLVRVKIRNNSLMVALAISVSGGLHLLNVFKQRPGEGLEK